MDTELPSALLGRQHRQIDAGVKGIVDGDGNLAALGSSLKLLRLHVFVEEELLFPPLAQSGLAMPVFVMKREHGEMWPLLIELNHACMIAAPVSGLHDSAEWLMRRLNVHNPKEEEIVYTAADRLVAGAPDGPLTKALAAAEVPAGWVCAMAPH